MTWLSCHKTGLKKLTNREPKLLHLAKGLWKIFMATLKSKNDHWTRICAKIHSIIHKVNTKKERWIIPVSNYQTIHGCKQVIWCYNWLKLDSMTPFVTTIHELFKQALNNMFCKEFYQWIPKHFQPIHILDKFSQHNMTSCCKKLQDCQGTALPMHAWHKSYMQSQLIFLTYGFQRSPPFFSLNTLVFKAYKVQREEESHKEESKYQYSPWWSLCGL